MPIGRAVVSSRPRARSRTPRAAPEAIVRGTPASSAPKPPPSDGRAVSRMPVTTTMSSTTFSRADSSIGADSAVTAPLSGKTGASASAPPPIVPAPRLTAPAVWEAASPLRMSACGRTALTESTYQASAGPLDSARAMPSSTYRTPNCQALAATARPQKASEPSPAETARTPRREMTSARPPVGSSSSTVVRL